MAGRYDVIERGGRLIVARSRSSALLDVAGLAALFLLGVPGLFWGLSFAANRLFGPGRLLALLLVLGALMTGLYAFLLLLRAYRASRLQEIVVLDREADTIARARNRMSALRDARRVELRRHVVRSPTGEAEFFAVVLMAGLAIPVAESASEAEMRACARRVAGYAGVPVVDEGW
jgi:hypothetical protein